MKLLFLILAGCTSTPAVQSDQPPMLAWLVVHVDPIPREGDEPCEDETLVNCGSLDGQSWKERTQNLEWLADRWLESGRTMDLELGPEAALAWAGDAELVEAMTASLTESGDLDPATTVADTVTLGQSSVSALVAGGAASLGVHVHDVLPATDGLWGAVYLNLGEVTEGGSPEACTSWEEEPLQEPRAEIVERVVSYGANGADALASLVGAPLESYTGHLPRTMAGKITVVDEAESLAPEQESGFPAGFAPLSLGSAYSECLTFAVDHQPFEAWPADEVRALLAGEGPPVVPGARVVGSMSKHLGVASDGSLGADARRLLQAMVNWRYQGLIGGEPRPWVFTFHTHLFDLYPGTPNGDIEEERGVRPQEGQKFRKDLDALGGLVDAFQSRPGWQGLENSEGAAMRWALPRDLDDAGSEFSYGQAGELPPEGMDRDSYPYLPLVAERLINTHLACAGALDDVEIYGMLRCSMGWDWAGDSPGYHCAEGEEPAWVYLLIPEAPTCLELPSEAALAAPVDADEMGAPTRCGAGVEVPVQGLIVEPADGSWWSAQCGPWG